MLHFAKAMNMRRLFVLAAAACITAATANADLTGVTFRVEASNETGSGSIEYSLDDLTYDQETNTYSWRESNAVDILGGDEEVIATLRNANVFIAGDPAINLGFAVQAGSSATKFTISTAGLTNLGINNDAQGQAGAAFTITDVDNTGVTFTGENGTGHGYLATYGTPTTDFARLIGNFSAGRGKSASSSDNKPANGYEAIAGAVDEMNAQVEFTLSANDLASGTNSFEIIPEPSSLALVGLGALSLIRRKR